MDEKEELVTERDVYQLKYDRLNKELTYILKGDERRVLDLDALITENRLFILATYVVASTCCVNCWIADVPAHYIVGGHNKQYFDYWLLSHASCLLLFF